MVHAVPVLHQCSTLKHYSTGITCWPLAVEKHHDFQKHIVYCFCLRKSFSVLFDG